MMKQSPIEKYAIRLHENIFGKILGMLYIAKMKPALKKAEKMLDDDPEFEAKVDSLMYQYDELERYLKQWCKYNPDDPRCTSIRKDRERVKQMYGRK